MFSRTGAVLGIFFALEGEGHYDGCARNEPKHKPCFRPQTNRITPMLHRKWIIWDLSIAIFSTKYETITSYWKQWLWTVLSLKVPVTTSCWNMKSYFQETAPSFHLNCLTAQGEGHTCLRAAPKTAPCNSYSLIPTAAGGWAAPAWVKWNLWETKIPEKCTDEQPRLTHRGTERPTSVWGGESWLQVFGVAGYSRTVSLPFPGKHSQDHGGPPAAFNASLVPQTDAKATGHLPTPIPKNTTSARLLLPEQSPGAFSCCSRQ